MVLNKLTIRGFSLVEVLVVSAVMLLVFGGLLVSFRYTLTLVSYSRAKLTAVTVANDQMEYIRSLPYDSVGTVSGIPPGTIPQVSTTSLNGIVFTKTILVNYVDDAKDGIGAADTNDITTDYKQAKVTVQWSQRGVPTEIFLVSNIIPKSIETSVGGGTLRVNVYNSSITPLPGADVRLVNKTIVPNIDVTKTTDISGVALFGGAPAGPDYEITVTAPGYSTDKTYKATTTLPNPTTLPVAVVEADISTMNFFIDQLSNLSVKVLANKTVNSYDEFFTNASGTATSTKINISVGTMKLASSSGLYATSGVAYLNAINPTPVDTWDLVNVISTVNSSTSVLVRFYTGTSSPYTLVPDADLAGNSAGFSSSLINLSGLSGTKYPALVVGLQLLSSSISQTPLVDQISVSYVSIKTPLVGASLNVRGNKTIGTMTDSSLVYKNSFTNTTNSGGLVDLPNIEWDAYTASVSGYDIREACSTNPLVLSPAASTTLEILTTTNSAHSLRLVVQTASGQVLPGAVITLKQGAFTSTKTTSSCGQVFFSGLTSYPDYILDITPIGFGTRNLTGIDITGDIVDVESF